MRFPPESNETMKLPDFFDRIPSLCLRDPLAELLGAVQEGMLEYRYADAVKWAGHSCPTVAGAWLMTRAALRFLYPDEVPMRGGLRVELREAQADANAGVVGGVIGLITGAAGEGGFKGLAGNYSRRGLLQFGVEQVHAVRFSCLDRAAGVQVDYHPARVPPDPAVPELMKLIVSGAGNAEDRALFARLWQARVERILIMHADDPELVSIHA